MNTGCAESEGAATHSTEAEGNAPPLFLDSVHTGCAEGEGAATHSAEAEGKAPPLFSVPMPSAKPMAYFDVDE